MSPAELLRTKKIFTPFSIIFIVSVAALYTCFAAYLLNYRLVLETLNHTFPLSYKATLLYQLATGIFASFGVVDSLFLIANGLLVGLSLVLIFRTLSTLEGMGKVKVSIGGATLLGLVAAGCGACGFTIFSLLGISASLSFLPFHGLEIHVLSFIVLLFSIGYMIRKLLLAQVCKLY